MGTIYARGNTLWVGHKDIRGKRICRPTEFRVGQEEQARKFLEAVERQVKAALEMGAAELGPVTVNRYAERWMMNRRERRVGSARDDETRLRRHASRNLASSSLRTCGQGMSAPWSEGSRRKLGQARTSSRRGPCGTCSAFCMGCSRMP